MSIQFTITDAGRAALIDSEHDGTNALKIAEVELGRGRYEPSKDQTELREPIKRLDTIAGQAVAADTLHVTVQDEGGDTYSVGEIGLITDSGVLFAVTSQPDWIIEKAEPTTLLLATDIVVASLDVSNIEFGDAAFLNPPATTDVIGVVELSEDREARAMKDKRRAITPSNLPALTASENDIGFVRLTTLAEAIKGANEEAVPSIAHVFRAFQQYGLGAVEVPRINGAEAAETRFVYSSDGIDGLSWPMGINVSRGGSRDVQLLIQSLGSEMRAIIRARDSGQDAAPFMSAELWHTGNHGPDSGLDADTVDGLEAEQIARKDLAREALKGSLGIGGATPGKDFDNSKAVALGDEDSGIRGGGDGVVELWANNRRIGRIDKSGLDVIGAGRFSGALEVVSNLILGGKLNLGGSGIMQLDGLGDAGSKVYIHGPGASGDDVLSIERRGVSDYVLRVGNRHQVWHAGNQGAGSGLDADTLDGQQGSDYHDASKLNKGTVPLARLSDSSTGQRGIVRLARVEQADSKDIQDLAVTPAGTYEALRKYGLGTADPDTFQNVDDLLGTGSRFTAPSGGGATGWFQAYGPGLAFSRNSLNTIVLNGRGNRLAFRGSNNSSSEWEGDWNELWHSNNFDPGDKFDKAGGTITGDVKLDANFDTAGTAQIGSHLKVSGNAYLAGRLDLNLTPADGDDIIRLNAHRSYSIGRRGGSESTANLALISKTGGNGWSVYHLDDQIVNFGTGGDVEFKKEANVKGNRVLHKGNTGDAVSRDVGTDAGNVLEVGAFGLGSNGQSVPSQEDGAPNRTTFFYSSNNIDGLSWPAGMNVSRDGGSRDVQWLISSLGNKVRGLLRARNSDRSDNGWMSEEIWHTGNLARAGLNVKTYDSRGTYRWFVPDELKSGLLKARVTVIGAGGGGGKRGTNAGSGGGGGGMAVALVDLAGVDYVDVTVGRYGSGGSDSSGGTGESGTSSSFGSYCSATGGKGGAPESPGAGGVGRGGFYNTSLGPGTIPSQSGTGNYGRSGSGGGPGGVGFNDNSGSSGHEAIGPGGGGGGSVGDPSGGSGGEGLVFIEW